MLYYPSSQCIIPPICTAFVAYYPLYMHIVAALICLRLWHVTVSVVYHVKVDAPELSTIDVV